MNIRYQALLCCLLIAPLSLRAQDGEKDDPNLVPNGSFEVVEGKLKRTGSIEMATGWKSPTGVPADLFSETVAGSPISVPRNQFGDQSALTGVNYAGLRWWSYQGKQPRSYLSAKFKKPLKKGQKYCVKYYVSLGDLSKYATNEVGAFISKLPVTKKDEANLTYNAQVPNLRTKIYDDMYAWQGVCGVYDAQGEEQYIIIGNFASNEKTDNTKPKRPKGETRPQLMHAYYFIDDVSVLPIKSDSECTCEQLDKAESEFIFSRRGALPPESRPEERLDAMVIYYKRFQRTIDRAMEPWLNEMVTMLNNNPNIRIKLTGHIDETEKDRARMRPDMEVLDMERAEALKEALLEAGIAGSRITVEGKGSTQLADDTGTEVGMSKNRRVEISIVK